MQIKRGTGELLYSYTTGSGPREQAYTARRLVDRAGCPVVVGNRRVGNTASLHAPTATLILPTRPTHPILALPG